MVICQSYRQVKQVLLFAAQYLTEWIKMTVIFISYDISLYKQLLQKQRFYHLFAGEYNVAI